ncbi:ribose-5-phosphate isomerase RpiA [uncultured Methanobrevibacter sp.]|uniref:ribose-5-phosphate isomerase RpiA n=1 Tax=uncultured Methanobrevibacter sp. TaxID=253161 RepID=UPI0025FE804A|nr:ribose-5-phosphate isomerase RpiA [uncultured Methanobrevibacter sp.]
MNLKQDVGYKAAEEVKDGQILGLGTGSTTHYFIEKVGMRVKEEEIEVMGIPTSYQSALLAQQWNIPITNLDEYSIDLAVDGADEIDPNLNLIKGGGAAHTLEKIVDYSADELIIIADDSKYVNALGRFPVPIEVIPKAKTLVENTLSDMGAKVEVRMGVQKDGPVITDNGNFIIDAKFDEIISPADMELELNTIPGVVENGLFTEMVDKVILGSKEGIKELKI